MRVIKPPVQMSAWSEMLNSDKMGPSPGFQSLQEINSVIPMHPDNLRKRLNNQIKQGMVEWEWVRLPGTVQKSKYYRIIKHEKTRKNS